MLEPHSNLAFPHFARVPEYISSAAGVLTPELEAAMARWRASKAGQHAVRMITKERPPHPDLFVYVPCPLAVERTPWA